MKAMINNIKINMVVDGPATIGFGFVCPNFDDITPIRDKWAQQISKYRYRRI